MATDRETRRLRAILLGLLLLMLFFLLWPAAKPLVAPPLLRAAPSALLPILLRWLQPIQLPPELLHDDRLSVAVATPRPPGVRAAPIQCDGDGISGARVQLIYARASDSGDRYALFLDSFRQYAYEIDGIFLYSAAETGGDRRVRWVHDGSCYPTVANVTLTAAGDDTFGNTISELQAQGYTRTDRKYLVFVDAAVYCGIGEIWYDDTPGASNFNNRGPNFARVDANCWSSIAMGHELVHTIGGVQLSAPHSSYDWHCTDLDDLMCRPTNGTPTQQLCSWVYNQRFDCNHDDYFHTAPPVGSYLATHWNTANSQYLIGAPTLVPTPTPCFRGNSGKPCR